MLNIYRTSPRAIKSVTSNVPFSPVNVAEYLRSCIFEHLRKKGARCTPSFRVVKAQQSHVFDARGTRRANEKLESSDARDIGMIDGYEELYCTIISFKTWYAYHSHKSRGCSFCCIFVSLIEFRLRSFFTRDLPKRLFWSIKCTLHSKTGK